MAEGFYNAMTHSNNAASAGIETNERPALVLREFFDKYVEDVKRHYGFDEYLSTIDVMAEKNIDISDYTRQQLTPAMISGGGYDVVVNIAGKRQTPDWLRGHNVIWWDIADPHGESSAMRSSCDEIETRIKKLIEVEKSGGDFRELDDDIDKVVPNKELAT
jgi:hypothetical protein